jgi:methyltransferase (TIGR00027 family)
MRPDKPSQTALRVALARAIESRLPKKKRLCFDSHAKYFLDAPSKRIYETWFRRKLYFLKSNRFMPGIIGSVMVRTRFIDDYLHKSIANGIEQLVILGAGYDTRAFRFAEVLDGIKVYEVDHPATQERKILLLKRKLGTLPAHVTYVPIRFNSEDLVENLTAAGYCKNVKTVFIWEGVTYYLTRQAVEKTLRDVTEASGSGSSIVFDYFPSSVADGSCLLKEAQNMRAFFSQLDEEIKFGIEPRAIGDFLSAWGYDNIRNFTYEDFKKMYLGEKRRKRRISELFSIASASVSA